MPFKYVVPSSDRVVFTRLERGCNRFMFVAIGSLFTLIGIGLIIFGGGIEMPFGMIRFIFPLFGLIAIYAGLALPRTQRRSTPDEIIFDNLNGRVEVNQQDSDIKTAFIYYDEIEDLILKIKKEESRSSSSTTSTRSYYSYHVYLVKKDGGQWELLKRGTEAAALEEIAKLKVIINLNAMPQRVDLNLKQSTKYNVVNEHHYTEINWRNKIGFGPIFLGAFVALFVTIGYIILKSGPAHSDFPIFGYVVAGFIGIVFLVVVAGNVLKMIKNSKTIYALVISSSGLDYVERDLSGRIQKTIHFPLADVHAVSFSFDTDSTMRKIFIYTHTQFQQQKSMKVSFNIEALKDMYNFYKNLVALEMQDLTPVEALHIENYIQQQIKDRGNIQVA
jgi:hypothetical protein